MSKRETEIKKITTEFSIWEVKLQNLSSLNLFDAHNLSEDSICELLNLILNYKLENLNALKMNFPAIDLGDKYNSICVQVTSSKSSLKIQKTIDSFLKNNLIKDYNELIIVILGKKQKSYSKLDYPSEFYFDPKTQILDFRDLLIKIRNIPIRKLENISNILKNENHIDKKKVISNAVRIKRNIALKKRLQRDFLRKLKTDEWEYASFDPSIRFTYSNALIRSIDDTKWPEFDDTQNGMISSWFKGEFYDFYDNGIELIDHGGQVIFDKKGYWDLIELADDNRSFNKEYKVLHYWAFLRIPYDYIVEYDMDTDPYYAIPSIYVRYAKDGMPYEEILYGIPGSYENKNIKSVFDKNKRRKLK